MRSTDQRQGRLLTVNDKRRDGMSMFRVSTILLTLAMSSLSMAAQVAEDAPFRIAVIDDMSGIYSGNSGPGTVLAPTSK